jgi:hypothetical protein
MAPATTPDRVPPTPALARVLGLVVIALMAVAIVYTAWIALANYDRIGV